MLAQTPVLDIVHQERTGTCTRNFNLIPLYSLTLHWIYANKSKPLLCQVRETEKQFIRLRVREMNNFQSLTISTSEGSVETCLYGLHSGVPETVASNAAT